MTNRSFSSVPARDETWTVLIGATLALGLPILMAVSRTFTG